MSWADEFFELMKKKKEEEDEEEIAPTFETSPYSAMGRLANASSALEQAKDNYFTEKKAKEEEDEAEEAGKVFTKGAFEDGYQFGDVTKSILGSVQDVRENLATGVLGIGEGLLNAGGTVVGGIAKLFGADEYADYAADFVAKDKINEKAIAKKIIGLDTWGQRKILGVDSEDSLLGGKADSLVQSGGQLLGAAATGGYGTAVIGATAFGNEAANAFQNDATYGEAVLSAAITAGAEMLTEKISGGIKFGGRALDDAATSWLARNVANKGVRTALQMGMDVFGEGGEEVLSGIMSALGQKLTYMEDKELNELFSKEDAIESFVGGALLGGIASGIKTGVSASQGKDAVTGLTQNEQSVVDKVYEDALKEAETEKGSKLTNKEKADIYDEVLEQMEKGYISTDTIEEVLGGETYKSYRDTVDSEDALLKEYDELGDLKESELTVKQRKRLNELEQQLEEMKTASKRSEFKDRLGMEVSELVKGDRLSESYAERSRRGQAFEADISQYDQKQRQTIQKAIDSGILNNTRRTHEFVDMVAKITADKGVLFDFTNNEKLKTSGFAVDGKFVNGFVTKDGVTINVNSAKSLNSIVGHEITHVLEGTEVYTELQKVITEYAKTKGDYQGRYDALTKLYANIEGANIDNELTADLVGDYLFTDADFVRNLSVKHRNVFQKIYDEIKYLVKVATAGSKEAKELAKVQRAFEKAYRESGKVDGTKYSMSSEGTELTKGQQEYFKDSKMRDEKGNLMVMYHGSQNAGFHVFDPGVSDDGTSLFFVDRNDVAASYSGTSETYEARTIRTAEDMNNFLSEIGYDQYEAVEKDGRFELLEDGDHVAWSDTAQGIYEEFCWYEGVGEGDANYKVYLNLTNPLEVDVQGRNWDNVSREFSQEIADKYKTLTEEEKATLHDLAGWGDIGEFRHELNKALDIVESRGGGDGYTRRLASAYQKLGEDINMYDLFSIAEDNFSEEAIKQFAVKQMNTRDYAKKAKAEGYDGVIFKNIVDFGGYGGAYTPSTVAIAFDSNQVKSVANEMPTGDKDIRFSISDPVEETRELMALHNLHTNELLKQLEMGGMVYPSVAITNPEKIAHEDFGDITAVLHRDAIDPKTSKYNHIYSSDAYTPTFPHVSYEASRDVAENVIARVRAQFDSLPDYYQRSLRSLRDYTNLNDYLNRWGGYDGLVSNFADDHGMMQLYLAEKGETVPMVISRTETALTDYQKALYQKVVDRIGEDEIKSLNDRGFFNTLGESRIAWTKEHLDALKDIYADDWSSDGTITKAEAMEIANEQKLFYWYKEAVSALEYLENGGLTVVEKEDLNATNAKVDEKIAGSDYKQWLKELFNGIEGQSGIRNNKDTFLPSGKRRSFSQLHDPVTIDNVIKAMRKKEQTGQGAFGTSNFGGAAVQEYGSIAEAKRNADMLGVIDESEYQDIKKRIDDRLFDIAMRYANGGDIIDAKVAIVEAVAQNESKAGIAKYLKQYDYVFEYADGMADEIIELRDYVRSLPRPYFEAKPRRAVGFDEVAVFVIPRNADVKLKQELLNRGYSIAEYDPDVEGDRQKVVNQFEEYKFSLSDVGQQPKQYGRWNVRSEDVALEEVAPVAENATPTETPAEVFDNSELFPDEQTPGVDELMAEAQGIMNAIEAYESVGDHARAEQLVSEYESIMEQVGQMERSERQRVDSLTEEPAPPEMEAPLHIRNANANPFASRDWYDVGNRKVKAFMSEHPEVTPFFQEMAGQIGWDLADSVKAERWYNDQLHYDSGGEKGFGGNSRMTSDQIAEMLDDWHMSYADIEKGIQSIMDGKADNAPAKRLEIMLDRMLRNGYKDFHTGKMVEPNQEYIDTLNGIQANEDYYGAFDDLVAHGDEYAPLAVSKTETTTERKVMDAPVAEKYEAIKPKPTKEPRLAKATPEEQAKSAKILFGEHQTPKQKSAWKWAKEHIFRHGAVFEDMSLKTGNRELQAKFDNIRRAESRAQTFIGKGKGHVKALVDVRKAVEKAGKTEAFNYYLYHLHNVDRMTLEQRFEDVPNKAVFGDSVTAEVSRKAAANLETLNPEFKKWARDVYAINKHLRQMMVSEGIISQETADLWQTMYPHYVPISRADYEGLNVNVPLDTKRTGVNAPIKKAKGGNSDFYNVFDTMGSRIEQTFKAIAKNRFGVELKNTLGTAFESEAADIDSVLESMDNHEELLQEGKNGESPTFTVFQNGERVKFAITQDMYDAMKPSQFTYTNEALRKVNNVRRDILTTYSPTFMLTNPIKDVQDILLNSQHPARTYAAIPEAIKSVIAKDQWYQERMENGGSQDSYFDGQTKTFKKEDGWFKKVMGFVPSKIQAANEIIEQVPRMAEYIASRKMGRSIDVSMLDAARVTTNFGAAGDFTNMLNRNGFTFLGASVEGFNQQVRNVREAKAEGAKGWAKLAGKYLAVGLPALLLNHALWDDDEEYAELSDYVKQNYYVIAKTEDGKFIRIPKGRAVAVIQDVFQQMENLITGNDEADFEAFGQLVINNLAPNNPLENNIIAPIAQAYSNKTWYGDDLVPTRLQDMPDAEQYDETTDSFSKWLGETFGISPYKANYVLDQYTGGVGDIALPYLTPAADGGGLGAALRDKFVTDPVLKNQNVSDFYDKMDELTKNANSMYATDEDVLRAKYMNTVNSKLSELYQQKREIQSGDWSDAKKAAAIRDIQQQIVDLTREGLGSYEDVNIQGVYATVGDQQFRWYEPGEDSEAEPGWQKLTEKQIAKQDEVTKGLGITPSEYWSDKAEYDFAYEYPEKYDFLNENGVTYDDYANGSEEFKDAWTWASKNPEKFTLSKAVASDVVTYRKYTGDLYDIKADKDEDGKSISGSRKEKVIDYINNMDAEYGEKIILFKSEYPADDTYNYDIIDYLNGREDISYEEMETILKELGFKVSSDGTITWD